MDWAGCEETKEVLVQAVNAASIECTSQHSGILCWIYYNVRVFPSVRVFGLHIHHRNKPSACSWFLEPLTMVVEIAGDGAPGNFGLTSYIGVGFLVEGVWVAMLTVKSFTVQAGSFDFVAGTALGRAAQSISSRCYQPCSWPCVCWSRYPGQAFVRGVSNADRSYE